MLGDPPMWLGMFTPYAGDWEPVEEGVWRGRTGTPGWLYALSDGNRWCTCPVTSDAAEDPRVVAYVIQMMRRRVTDAG